jgi:hypothetical protein
MTLESAPATTAVAPDRPPEFRQKSDEGETTFTFHPDRLDYAFAGRQGTKVRRQIPWSSVPSRFHLKDRAHPNNRLGRWIRVATLLLLFVVGSKIGRIDVAVLLCAYAAALCALTIWLSRHLRLGHSLLGTKSGNILIFRGLEHDVILDRIMQGRATFFRRLATIDPERTLRWNLQRLRWLVEQEVVAPEEFATAQQAMLPALAESLLKRPAETPDRRIEQHFFNSLFAFDFNPGHLAYRRRTALGSEYAVNLDYSDLAEPNLDVQTESPSRLVPHVILWSGIVTLGYLAAMYGSFLNSFLAGPDGMQRAPFVFAPGIAAFAISVVLARRLLRVTCTKLPSGVMILKDKHHDEVIAELRRRRRAALAALAEPDPLLSRAEQANLLASLRNLGILDAARIPNLLARAAVLQDHLGLADPEPRSGDADSGEPAPRHDRPPQATIH